MNLLDLLYIPLGLATAPFWLRKRREGWDQRFGHVRAMFDDSSLDPTRPRVMLHSVSVGEVNALRAIVPMLADSAEVFVSTTTDTGLARAQSLFGDMSRVHVVRYPLDCSWMVKRFLGSVRPDVVGLVELEVWPNFIKICESRGIPIGIINGRISSRSYKGYRRLRALLRPTFARLCFACVQDQDYADRIAAMGTPDDRIRITGTMKWDSVRADHGSQPGERAQQIAGEMGVDLERPVV
ncbi:MAG: 3-deoxy-D-manno-octulosonic acid transferase, partial [Phycisphaerales bacterium]